MTDLQHVKADIISVAEAIQAPYDEAVIDRVMACYHTHFARITEAAISMRTTTKPNPTLSFRYVDFDLDHDPLQMAYDAHLLTAEDHPLHALLPDLQQAYGRGGYGVDATTHNGFEKIWLFLNQGPLPLADVLAFERLPPSVHAHAAHLQRMGLDRVSVFAFNYASCSINLYFMVTDPQQFAPEGLAKQLDDLGFPAADESEAALAARTGCAAYTFRWDSDEVERIAHYFPVPKPHFPSPTHPRLQTYVDAIPFLDEQELFIYGISFGPQGTHHKPEAEYNGAMRRVFEVMMGTVV